MSGLAIGNFTMLLALPVIGAAVLLLFRGVTVRRYSPSH